MEVRAEDADVVHDGRQVRQHLAQLRAALAVSSSGGALIGMDCALFPGCNMKRN